MLKYVTLLSVLIAGFIPTLLMAETGVSTDAFILVQNSPWLAAIGLGLIILEFMLPTKGILGLIGVALFVTGTYSLAEHDNPSLRLSWGSVIVMNLLVVGTFLATMFLTWRGYVQKHTAITESFLTHTAVVLDWKGPKGRVKISGSIWQARSEDGEDYKPGDLVTVTGQDNLTLIVSYKGVE